MYKKSAQKSSIKKAFGIFGKLIKVIFIILLGLMLAFNIFKLVSNLVFKNDLPKLFGYADAVVLTGSMANTINAGDLIVIK